MRAMSRSVISGRFIFSKTKSSLLVLCTTTTFSALPATAAEWALLLHLVRGLACLQSGHSSHKTRQFFIPLQTVPRPQNIVLIDAHLFLHNAHRPSVCGRRSFVALQSRSIHMMAGLLPQHVQDVSSEKYPEPKPSLRLSVRITKWMK